jgi:prephenate dehydrogenase
MGEIGGSMALALAESGLEAHTSGYDREKKAARFSQEAGAIDRIVLNPYKAAAGADLIVITQPPADTDEFLEDIAGELRPGTIVLDCSGLSSARLRWALSNFESARYYLAALPILRPDYLHRLERDYRLASPDLFQDSSLALVVPAETPEAVVSLSVNLAETFGSAPFFLDASEMDAVTSLTGTLPSLLGIGLLRLAHKSPSWPDVQRLAGRTFAASTHSPGQIDAKDLTRSLLENQPSLLVHLDQLMEELHQLRSMIEGEDEERLQSELRETLNAYKEWISRRSRANWHGEAMAPKETERTGLIGDLLGINPLMRRKKG